MSNLSVQEAIDDMIDQKAELMRDYQHVKTFLHSDPVWAYPILFDIEGELEELNDKYKLLMEYVKYASRNSE